MVNVLAIVFVAVAMGLEMKTLEEETNLKRSYSKKCLRLFLYSYSFVVNKFARIGIFCLLTRTFAIYGIDLMKRSTCLCSYSCYCIICIFILRYPIYLMSMARVNPKPFMKKMVKVALFGFSTSSSAATLPINKRNSNSKN